MKIVSENKQFKFKGLCPYCGGNLTYVAFGWEQDENGLWAADSFDVECSTEPNMDSEEWEDWMQQHSDMPYVNQLPVDKAVEAWIKERYRFNLEH